MSMMHSRQSVGCPHSAVKDLSVLVVGAGAIGRQVIRQIGLLGVSSITIVDDDIIEEHNCVPQMFPTSAIGKHKVAYIQEELSDLCPALKVVGIPIKWNPKIKGATPDFNVVFPTVDNIEVRGAIFSYYQEKCDAMFDVRIGGDTALILSAVGTFAEKDWYKKTLFKKSEAARNACAQPMTNFMANISSGLAINQFANWASKRAATTKIIEFCALDYSITSLSEEVFSD